MISIHNIIQTYVCEINNNIKPCANIVENEQNKSPIFMEVYEIIKQLRIDNDLTQENVAEYLGMKQQQYSNYERGLRALPIDNLKALCKFYGVSADYILGLPKNMEYPE